MRNNAGFTSGYNNQVTRQVAEQVIAGVVLSEQIATSVYGVLRRAQWRGERNLVGLVVNANLMASDIFHVALTDPLATERVAYLAGPHIAQTVAVESAGRSAVILTRGVGRCQSVIDLLTESKSLSGSDGRFSIPVAGAIAKSVAEALAAAHGAGVIHGAVHPRSVWIGDDGVVQLGDFVVVEALRRAVAHGEMAALWQGLAGYVAPELAPGRPPTTSGDLFAVGALMSALLTGEPPPGPIYATPGIERFVRRAIDVDPLRRYPSATDLLDSLHEAMEDDRWEFADSDELAVRAGVSAGGGDVDDATEDFLASLAQSPAQPAIRRRRTASTGGELDALLGDLGDRADSTGGFDDTDVASDLTDVSHVLPGPVDDLLDAVVPQAPMTDSASHPIDTLTPGLRAASPPEATGGVKGPALPVPSGRQDRRKALPNEGAQGIELADTLGDTPPRLTSRMPGVIALIAMSLVGYFVYHQYTNQQQLDAQAKQRAIESQRAADEKQRQAIEDLPDPGVIRVTSNPPQAGVWLKIGRTPVKSFQLSSAMMHELRLEGVDGYDPVDTQVVAAHWNRSAEHRTASIAVTLPRTKLDARTGRPVPAVLPPMPPKPPPTRDADFPTGHGAIEITSTPPGAEVWMYIGMTNNVELRGIRAGLPYELRLLSTGYRPGFISVTVDEWRSGGDTSVPIDRAQKLAVFEKSIDLIPDPAAIAHKRRGQGR